MGDEIVYSENGRTYKVRGVGAKAQSVFGASQEIDLMLSNRVTAATNALAQWRGPHAGMFVEEANTVLAKIASQKIALWRAHNVLSSFPEKVEASWGSVRYQDSIYDGAQVEVVTAPGVASAQTPKLRDYATTAAGQDERFPTLAGMVNLDGITAEVTYQRPLTDAERQSAIDHGEHPRDLDGATTAQTDTVDVSTLITLPTPQDDIPALTSKSRALAEFTVAVAAAFENADQAMLAFLAADPNALQNRLTWLREDPRRWSQLSATEQRILMQAVPRDIGGMNGLPTVVRDEANRIVLQQSKDALRARIAEIELLLANPMSIRPPDDGRPHTAPHAPPHPYPEIEQDLEAEMERLQANLQGIDVLEQRLAPQPGRPPAFLLGFSAEGNGRAIVAIGNPDYATNVATYIPGTFAKLGDISGDIDRIDGMYADANGLDPNHPTSVILWMDYDAPQSIPMAMSDSYADRAAPDFRAFQAGLDVAHVSGGAHTSVMGHSYGTVVIGHAATGGSLNADEMIFVGSPGVDADHASDLGVDPGHVWATTAGNDPIQFAPDFIHGRAPVDDDFGAQEFYSYPGSSTLHAHSEYWDDGNPAQDNMAAIITGNYSLVTTDPAPAPPPPPGMPWPYPPPPPGGPPPGPPLGTPNPQPGPSPVPR